MESTCSGECPLRVMLCAPVRGARRQSRGLNEPAHDIPHCSPRNPRAFPSTCASSRMERTRRRQAFQESAANRPLFPDAASPRCGRHAGTRARATEVSSSPYRRHNRVYGGGLDPAAAVFTSRCADVSHDLQAPPLSNPVLNRAHQLLLFLEREAFHGVNRTGKRLHGFIGSPTFHRRKRHTQGRTRSKRGSHRVSPHLATF